MNDAKQLGMKIALLLTAAGALGPAALGACGGDVTTGGSASSASSSSGASSSAGGGGGSVDGGAAGAGGAPSCFSGMPPTRDCFTLAELEYQINNPPMGGDIGGDAGTADGGVMLTECPEPGLVQDGCCNAAVAGPEMDGELCCYWFCTGACCGRPFTIEGEARLAEVILRDDFGAPRSSDASIVKDDETRGALVSAWLGDARMEHASIASFARFTLELLAHGAPADLIEASQRASLDEIEHAKVCFGIASRLDGKSYGPGPLDMAGVLSGERGRLSLAESAAYAVAEGCVGETIAALLARAALEKAEDPDVRAALTRIAADEEAHAELSWRFVAWALSTGGEAVRAAVAQAFAEGIKRAAAPSVDAPSPGVDRATWHCYGRLSPEDVKGVYLSALRDVLLPCSTLALRARPGISGGSIEDQSARV